MQLKELTLTANKKQNKRKNSVFSELHYFTSFEVKLNFME